MGLSALGVILLAVAVIFGSLFIWAVNDYEPHPILGPVFAVATCFFLYQSYDASKLENIQAREVERREDERRQKEQEQRDATPHVIRDSGDGCKVYAFKSGGSWHYFTRCDNSKTTTMRSYEHCTGSGKSRSCKTLYENIDSE